MPWWGWVVVGAALLGSELVVPSQFFMVFLGAAALVVGLCGLLGFVQPVWQQWLAFGLMSVVFLLFFRRRLWAKMDRDAPLVDDRVVGEIAVANERIEPGGTGRAELRGTSWTARNVGDEPILPGGRARTEEVEGLVLVVRPESK